MAVSRDGQGSTCNACLRYGCLPHPVKQQRAHEVLRHEPRSLLASTPEHVEGHPVEAHSQKQREQQHLQRQQEADLRSPAATVTVTALRITRPLRRAIGSPLKQVEMIQHQSDRYTGPNLNKTDL